MNTLITVLLLVTVVSWVLMLLASTYNRTLYRPLASFTILLACSLMCLSLYSIATGAQYHTLGKK